MLHGQYASRTRYRDRAYKRTATFLLALFLFGGALVLGFFTGRQYAVVQLSTLEKEVSERDKSLKSMQEELVKLRGESQTAVSRLEQVKSQYEKDLPPDGPMREIIDMIKKQLSGGMPAERLAFVIRSARPPRNCSDPTSKRFVVKTPAYKGAESTVSINDGAVVISGSGMSSRSREGHMESWYDPTQAVHIIFKTADGLSEKKDLTLPFQHAVVSKGREYRFTLSEGEKSFVKVTFDSCDYP